MKPEYRATRPDVSGLASSASALIALVAVAALMTSMPGGHARIAPVEARTALTEGQSARELAAAVAAAARELVGAERLVPQASAVAFHLDFNALPRVSATHLHFDAFDVQFIRSRVIAERLIDMPPPVC
jgi:hypothetical protein